jgi:hypothetical protein
MSHFVGRAVTSGVIGLFVMAYGDYPLTGFRDLRAFRTRHPAPLIYLLFKFCQNCLRSGFTRQQCSLEKSAPTFGGFGACPVNGSDWCS